MEQPQVVNLLVKHRGWILEALVRESASEIEETIHTNYFSSTKREILNPMNLQFLMRKKNGERNIYVHHQILDFVDDLTMLSRTRNRLLLTHFDPENQIPSNVLRTATHWDRILVQNSQTKKILLNSVPKLNEERVSVYFGAVNRDQYFPANQRQVRKYVLIVGDCKPRKNPNLLSQVLKICPEVDFVVHGKHWEDFFDICNITEYPNVTYVPFKKNRNPVLVREASLLLSLSQIEGGPIPILEALASGVRVLCTDTGFARDIVGKEQGIVLEKNPSVPNIAELLRDELKMVHNERRDLLFGKFTWEELGKKIYR